jgi:hypothetical protein
MTTEEFIQKAKEVHGDRYDYSKVQYINTKTKVCIICKEHGEFWQRANNHIIGHGCHKCAVKASSIPKPRIWTKEKVFEEARKYSTRREFQDKAKGAYSKALQHGWLEDMHWLKLIRRTWTKEDVMAEAQKYTTRTHFSQNASGAYGIARRNGWLDDFFPKNK